MPDGKTGYRKSKKQAKLDCGAVLGLKIKVLLKQRNVINNRSGS